MKITNPLTLALIASVLVAAPASASAQSSERSDRQRSSPDRVFAHVDANKDGVISKSEFSSAHAKRGNRQGSDNARQRPGGSADQMFARIDANGDGSLTKAELKSAHDKRMGRQVKHGNGQNQPRR